MSTSKKTSPESRQPRTRRRLADPDFARRLATAENFILLEVGLLEHFPNSRAVNAALHELLELRAKSKRRTPSSR